MCEKCNAEKRELTEMFQDGIAQVRAAGSGKAMDQQTTRLMVKTLGLLAANPLMPLLNPQGAEMLGVCMAILIQHGATLKDMAPDPTEDESLPPPTPDSLPDSIHDL